MKWILAALVLLGAQVVWAQTTPQQEGGAAKKLEAAPTKRVRQGGTLMAAKIVERVQPIYPPPARKARISGAVNLHAVIGTDGAVKQLEVISGHPILVQSALDAVWKWRYRPTLLNGEAVEVDTTVEIIFKLGK
jgi:periplasmic protein TonB